MRKLANVAMGLVLGLSAACGGNDGGGSGGPGGDPPDAAPVLTLGTICNSIGTAYCTRAQVCGLLGPNTVMQCETVAFSACCDNANRCGTLATGTTQAAVSACVNAFPSFSCSLLGQGMAPASCGSLKAEAEAEAEAAEPSQL
jgi:hypothetical protein